MGTLKRVRLLGPHARRREAADQCCSILGNDYSGTAIDILLDDRLPMWARLETCLSLDAAPAGVLRRFSCDILWRITPDRLDYMTTAIRAIAACFDPDKCVHADDSTWAYQLTNIRCTIDDWVEPQFNGSLRVTVSLIRLATALFTFDAVRDIYDVVKTSVDHQRMLGPDYEMIMRNTLLRHLWAYTASSSVTYPGVDLLSTTLPRRNYDNAIGG